MINNVNCPFEILANMISEKYKIAILWHLNKDGFKRFSELQLTHNPSSKVLSSQLRQLGVDFAYLIIGINPPINPLTPPIIAVFKTILIFSPPKLDSVAM